MDSKFFKLGNDTPIIVHIAQVQSYFRAELQQVQSPMCTT